MFDGIVDAQYRRKVLEVCTPARFELAFEEVLNDAVMDNPLADAAMPWLKQNESAFADLCSRTAVKFLLGDHDGKMRATAEADDNPRPVSRRLVRMHLIRHLRDNKGLTRKQARLRADQVTDDDIDTAVGELPKQGMGDWFSGLVDWIKNNWLTILQALAALLPLLLLI